MHPLLEKITYAEGKSFQLKKVTGAFCTAPWHFHPEYELVLILKGKGIRHIGDAISPFGPGDLVFLGHNLPHIWISNPVYKTNGKKDNSSYYVLQFNDQLLPSTLLSLPEFISLKKLLEQSRYGLWIKGGICKKAKMYLQHIEKSEGLEKYILFLRLMDLLSKNPSNQPLARAGYVKNFSVPVNSRLEKVYRYVMDHCHEEISVKQAADIALMNVAAFCRFFHKASGRTFTRFVNEIRIGKACRLFTEKDISISEAAYACGYNTLSYFNRQFKKITGLNPQQYRRKIAFSFR